ncbi:MAG: AIR synthase-related protein [Candidatus Nezhaarchaeales archaeon]
MELDKLLTQLRSYKGLARKSCIGPLAKLFSTECKFDDAGWFMIGDEYVVVSCDGIAEDLIREDPFLAGLYSVLVCVNDVIAKGARPLGYAGIVASSSSSIRMSIVEGLRKALRLYDLALLKMHTHPDTTYDAIDGCVVGRARKIIPSSTAKPGQDIIMAVDLDGSSRLKGWVCCFDTIHDKTPEQVKKLIDGMVLVAEKDLASASRDISAPGILGSLAMLCESSGVGALVDLDSIPRPSGMDLELWLKTYPSFGFILVSSRAQECIQTLKEHGYTASVIGKTTNDKRIVVTHKVSKEVFMDLNKESIFH